jgi:hypothetical protein
VGLTLRPAPSLRILWDMIIPLLPAVFLVNPMLWRNVCPLATISTFRRNGQRVLDGRSARAAWVVGMLLLLVLVPARRFVFNTSGLALSGTIVAVAAIAFVSGFVFSRRAGFCNAICPVLPVEKLYGQRPLLSVSNPRCADCSLCTPLGCIDLAATKTVAQTLGPRRRDRRWLVTPFGVFAAGFPGFIVAFSTLGNVPLAGAGSVYVTVLLYSLVSYVAVAAIAIVGRISAALLLPLLGATAFMLYYWFGAPIIGRAYGVPDAGPLVIRAGAALLLAVWLARARRQGDSGARR